MSRTLSVFLNSDRIYIAAFEPTAKGLELIYLNSTECPFDPEFPDDDRSVLASQEFGIYLEDLGPISGATICLPAESALLRQIPAKQDMTKDELGKLVNLEIRSAFSQYDPSMFYSRVIPLAPRLDTRHSMLAVMIQKSYVKACESLFAGTNIPVLNFDISQLNAHNAFIYNYPEQHDKTVAILGVQNQFIDVSVIQNCKPLYYNLASYSSPDDIGAICENEFTRIMTDYAGFIDSAYLFGLGLTKPMLDTAQQTLMGLVMESGRANAFRMISTKLTDRDRKYCAATAHIYMPCVGAVLPPYHETIKLN
jgi:hypothetical protein